jgi:hypothetical protein
VHVLGTHCYIKGNDWDREGEGCQSIQIELGSWINGEIFQNESEGLSMPAIFGVLSQ